MVRNGAERGYGEAGTKLKRKLSWLEVRGRRARREGEVAEAGPAVSETCGVWAECLAGSHQDSEMVLSANRKKLLWLQC